MYKGVIKKGLIMLLIILLGLLIYLIKLSYKENNNNNDPVKTSTTSTLTTSTTTTTTTTTIVTEPTTSQQTTSNMSIYFPYHVEAYDNYSIDNISVEDIKTTFSEKRAVVAGDSMAEGLTAYQILDESNVVWHRGRRIDNMNKDLEKIKELNPNYLFLTYGSNDLELWTGRTASFINAYNKTINMLKSELPGVTIIINSILPASTKKTNNDQAFAYQEEFNNALKELANSLGIPFLENSPYLLNKEKPYSSDGVHPKSFYFTLWAKHMTSYLKTQ